MHDSRIGGDGAAGDGGDCGFFKGTEDTDHQKHVTHCREEPEGQDLHQGLKAGSALVHDLQRLPGLGGDVEAEGEVVEE